MATCRFSSNIVKALIDYRIEKLVFFNKPNQTKNYSDRNQSFNPDSIGTNVTFRFRFTFRSIVLYFLSRLRRVSLHVVSHCLGENERQVDLRSADRKKDFHPGSSILIRFIYECERRRKIVCHSRGPSNTASLHLIFFRDLSKRIDGSLNDR